MPKDGFLWNKYGQKRIKKGMYGGPDIKGKEQLIDCGQDLVVRHYYKVIPRV